MKNMLANPRFAPVISFILCVLPFIILEWTTRSNAPRTDASFMLWVVLWLLSTGFMVSDIERGNPSASGETVSWYILFLCC